MVEQDVIGHLMDVERLAYDLLLNAQTEADKRKTDAKEKAEQEFLAQYEQILAGFEAEFARSRVECEKGREEEYKRFDAMLSAIAPDRASFNACLERYFFGN